MLDCKLQSNSLFKQPVACVTSHILACACFLPEKEGRKEGRKDCFVCLCGVCKTYKQELFIIILTEMEKDLIVLTTWI